MLEIYPLILTIMSELHQAEEIKILTEKIQGEKNERTPAKKTEIENNSDSNK